MLYYHPISKNIDYSSSVILKVIDSKHTMFYTNVISDFKTMSRIKSLIYRSYCNLYNYKIKTAIPLILAYKTTGGLNPIFINFQRIKYTKI